MKIDARKKTAKLRILLNILCWPKAATDTAQFRLFDLFTPLSPPFYLLLTKGELLSISFFVGLLWLWVKVQWCGYDFFFWSGIFLTFLLIHHVLYTVFWLWPVWTQFYFIRRRRRLQYYLLRLFILFKTSGKKKSAMAMPACKQLPAYLLHNYIRYLLWIAH